MAIREEQAAFDAQLESLLATSAAGKYVVMHDGTVQGVFDTQAAAYADGLHRLGSDAEFLVACVRKALPVSISISWDLGLVRVE